MKIFNEYGVLNDNFLVDDVNDCDNQSKEIFELAKKKGATPVELRALCELICFEIIIGDN